MLMYTLVDFIHFNDSSKMITQEAYDVDIMAEVDGVDREINGLKTRISNIENSIESLKRTQNFLENSWDEE
jgi:prefoldin subunit 5